MQVCDNKGEAVYGYTVAGDCCCRSTGSHGKQWHCKEDNILYQVLEEDVSGKQGNFFMLQDVTL